MSAGEQAITELIAEARKWPREFEGQIMNDLADEVERLRSRMAAYGVRVVFVEQTEVER